VDWCCSWQDNVAVTTYTTATDAEAAWSGADPWSTEGHW